MKIKSSFDKEVNTERERLLSDSSSMHKSYLKGGICKQRITSEQL